VSDVVWMTNDREVYSWQKRHRRRGLLQ